MKTTKKTLLVITFASCVCVLLGSNGVQAQALDPDLNDDGVVNGRDVSMVARCLGKGKKKKNQCEVADIDGDGDVDTGDLHLITGAIGQTGFPVAPSEDRIAEEEDGQKVIKDEIVVMLDFETADPATRIEEIANATGGVVIGAVQETFTYQVQYDVPDLGALEAIRLSVKGLPDVVAASLHYLATDPFVAIPNDIIYGGASNWDEDHPLGNNWNLELIQAPSAWDINTGDPSIPVAVIDNDIDRTHIDLSNNVASSSGRRIVSDGHGTHVAGTICAQGNNGIGVTGVAWDCSLRLYNMSSRLANVYTALEAQQAMINAANAGARIVNMSLQWIDTGQCGKNGTGTTRRQVQQMNDIFRQAIVGAKKNNKDVLWVFGAGNECRDVQYASPASLTANFPENTMAVASVDPTAGETSFANLSSFSNTGHLVTVAAPGRDILSTGLGNYLERDGTSMAAAHVSGLAALVLSEHPNFSASDVKKCIVDAAELVGASVPGRGFNVINAPEAVECASTPPPPPGPDCVDPPANLVSWWPGDNDAGDIQSGNDGILAGEALAGVPGLVDGAFRLEGMDSHIRIPHSNVLNLNVFSIDAWIYPKAFSITSIIQKGGLGTTEDDFRNNYRLATISDGRVLGRIGNTTAAFDIQSAAPLILNVWQHVAFTYDSSFLRLYINGVEAAVPVAVSITPYFSPSDLIIGRYDWRGTPFGNFNGFFDEVSIYNRALSTQEIQDIFNAGSAGKCKGNLPPPPPPGQNGLSFNPDPVAFGAVEAGDAATIDLTVTNNNIGTVSCSATAANWTPTGFGVGGFDFAPSSLSIPGPGSAITTVFFTPRRVDTFTMQMKFVCNGAGLENFQKVIDVSGTGVEPAPAGE